MKKVLTIAGSDSSGGAGIQADLKTFAARGVFGMSAITALTAQNTNGVQGVYEINAEFVGQQIDSVMTDIGADAWKTGMLANSSIISLVAKKAKQYNMKKFVVDPVMVAKGGDSLIQKEAREAIISELLPVAYIATPNHHEAEVLTGIRINNLENASEAAIGINKLGVKYVIIKGGRIPHIEDAVDILYDGNKIYKFIAPRIDTPNTHGTGCTFASAIAAEIATGNKVIDSIRIAKAYLTAAIQRGSTMNIGHGFGPVDHSQDCIVEIDLNIVKIE